MFLQVVSAIDTFIFPKSPTVLCNCSYVVVVVVSNSSTVNSLSFSSFWASLFVVIPTAYVGCDKIGRVVS